MKKKKENFQKVEIIGNPVCYDCLNLKDYKNIQVQLFYCSHCSKLFCEECLSKHYSDYMNIEESY